MTTESPPIRRVERGAIAVAGLALLGAYVWAAHYRLDPLDEGYFLYTSSRVLAGELPYRDFSTPYTPLFFYLNALLFTIFGQDIVVLRISQAIARVVLLLLLYLIARRLMPPTFAILPLAILFIEDQLPGSWETHPAWWATLAFIGAVWCACRHYDTGRVRWWLLAAGCAGLAFGFKQNLGIFAMAALAGLALVEGPCQPGLVTPSRLRALSSRLPTEMTRAVLRWAGPVYLGVLALGTLWMMRIYSDPFVVVLFAAPFLGLMLESVRSRSHASRGLPESAPIELAVLLGRLAMVGLMALGVTLVWLPALLVALGLANTPLTAFIGGIETAGYFLPIDQLRPTVWPALGLTVLAPAVVWILSRRWALLLRAAIIGTLIAIGMAFTSIILRRSAEVHPSPFKAALLLSVQATGNLILYLPFAAFWTAFRSLWISGLGRRDCWSLRWVLLAGSLLALNQFPRMDETHLQFSGLLSWVAGAYSLWHLQRWLLRGASSASRLWPFAILLSLTALPLAAVWPTIDTRRSDLLLRHEGGRRLGPPTYVPVGLPGLGVDDIDVFAVKYQRIAAFFREYSPSGERIFVYPAAPLLYYVANRPNATRFNHFFPGLLSSDDEDETIARLEETPAAWVIWDSFGEGYWVTGRAYNRLTDYIWDAYEPVESIGGYEIMQRKLGR